MIILSAVFLLSFYYVGVECRVLLNEKSYKCPANHYMKGVNTTDSLSSVRIICQPLPPARSSNEEMFCTSEADLRGTAVGAMCRDDGFLVGFSVKSPIYHPKDLRFTFDCCERRGLKVVTDSCYTSTHQSNRGFVQFKEDQGDIIKGIGLIYDTSRKSWTWRTNICLLHGLSNIDKQSYKLYPSAAATLYGESSTGVYSSVCGDREIGSVVYKIDSIVGENNRDRGFNVHCKDLNKLGLELGDLKPVAARLDIPEPGSGKPSDWLAGCKDNEILTGINSLISNGVRRYEFLCYTYARVEIDPGTCRFVEDTDDLDHAVQTYPDSEWFAPVFRGVAAQYLPLENDRRFAYEKCLSFISKEPKLVPKDTCRFGIDLDVQVSRPIPTGTIYLMYRTGNVDECAKMCQAHPFCFSLVWEESFLEANKLNCGFSYKKTDSIDYCKKKSVVWGGDLPRKRKLWISCFTCPAVSKASLLKKGLIIR